MKEYGPILRLVVATFRYSYYDAVLVWINGRTRIIWIMCGNLNLTYNYAHVLTLSPVLSFFRKT